MPHVPGGKLISVDRPLPSATTASLCPVNETPMASESEVLV